VSGSIVADLYVDSGNSRIKLARAATAGIERIADLDFDDASTPGRFNQCLAEYGIDRIVLASVSRGRRAEQTRALLDHAGLPVLRVATVAALGRLRVAYPEPSQLGVDRFLALLAASDDEAPCLLLSFGSALTADVLDADGRHRGGIIAPSPDFQRQAMRSGFPGLFEGDGQAGDLADNTDDALASGIAHQCLGMIERIHRQAFDGRDVRIWVTGGAAWHWLPLLPASSRPAPDILFRGMQRYLQLCKP
jgi:type III pantothenate kinase